jgi:hypothetical protein
MFLFDQFSFFALHFYKFLLSGTFKKKLCSLLSHLPISPLQTWLLHLVNVCFVINQPTHRQSSENIKAND